MDNSNIDELKPILVYKNPKEIIPFNTIVVPSSMRSPLWKYFGFPANKDREIITKNRIICVLCKISLSYNKNTTNLSTHLKNKHSKLLAEMNININKHKMNEYEHNSSQIEQIESSISTMNGRPKRSKPIRDFDDNVESPHEGEVHPTGTYHDITLFQYPLHFFVIISQVLRRRRLLRQEN